MMIRPALTLRDLPAPGAVNGAASCSSHDWRRVPETVGFFFCAACSAWAVCPGCLDSLNVALRGADAGLVVIWCAAHDTKGRARDGEA